MIKQFDMELFMAAVLTGSYATRKRHLRQAKIIQAAIADRWKQEAGNTLVLAKEAYGLVPSAPFGRA
ncbi:hypothetical protein SAMN03159304_05891 [Pseudomonas sp. NFACC24-1]|nr:hypothetical protein SAMN03159304_05891 [Pseudomonas sp. NFACC24-1]